MREESTKQHRCKLHDIGKQNIVCHRTFKHLFDCKDYDFSYNILKLKYLTKLTCFTLFNIRVLVAYNNIPMSLF